MFDPSRDSHEHTRHLQGDGLTYRPTLKCESGRVQNAGTSLLLQSFTCELKLWILKHA